MKEPTTPYSIDVNNKREITRDFLEGEGWVLVEDKPLYEAYEHKESNLLKCSIGLYGGFSVMLMHWCNNTPEKCFSTCNPDLTKADYMEILRMLNIKIG